MIIINKTCIRVLYIEQSNQLAVVLGNPVLIGFVLQFLPLSLRCTAAADGLTGRKKQS